MAQVTVRVKLIRTYEVICEGTNAKECWDNILDNNGLDELYDIYECAEIVEGSNTYDEPEEEEESNATD